MQKNKSYATKFIKRLEKDPLAEALSLHETAIDLFNNTFDVASGVDNMSGKVVPYQASEGLVKAVGKCKPLTKCIADAIAHGAFAGHLAARDNLMNLGNTTGSAFLLRDLAEAHPELCYNEELAEDIKEVLIEDQECSFRDSSAKALAQTLNSFAAVGKMDPKSLMNFYKTFEDGSVKSNIMLDLNSRIKGECLIKTDDVMAQFSHDVTEIPVNQLNTVYRTLLPLEESDDVVNSVFEHTLNLMSASPDENTYMRMCASREMVHIFAVAPESDALKKAGEHILDTIDRSITDADNETPRDENQALAEYLEVGAIVVNRLPELGTRAMNTANNASNVIAEKLSHPKHDWNWSLSVEPSAELKRVAAEAAQKPIPAETQLENYYRVGREIIEPIITQALTAPKPNGP